MLSPETAPLRSPPKGGPEAGGGLLMRRALEALRGTLQWRVNEGQTGWRRAEGGSLVSRLERCQRIITVLLQSRGDWRSREPISRLSPDSWLLRDLRETGAGKHTTLNETRMFTLAQSPRSRSLPAGPMAAARLHRASQWKRRCSSRSANAGLVLQVRSQWRARTACNHATVRSAECYCHTAATQLPGRRTK